jgi:hypothetical protein
MDQSREKGRSPSGGVKNRASKGSPSRVSIATEGSGGAGGSLAVSLTPVPVTSRIAGCLRPFHGPDSLLVQGTLQLVGPVENTREPLVEIHGGLPSRAN